jgi:hypothetical protein
VDHNTDEHAVDRGDMYIKHGSNTQVSKTTKGWQWKYVTTSWEQLADLRESNPVKVAEYTVYRNLHDAPAFVW